MIKPFPSDRIGRESMKSVKVHRAWADVGSHGGIFFFEDGPVGRQYPGLLHIFKDRVSHDLVEVEIRSVKRKKAEAAHEKAEG